MTVFLKQGTGGSFMVTWPGAAKFAGGTAPTLSTAAGKIDVIVFAWNSAVSAWFQESFLADVR